MTSEGTTPDGARREPRPGRLDRETILAAAERIVQTDGLAAMTMRRVGAEIQADPTALYRHFSNKRALVVELADRAFGRIRRIDPELPWRDGLRQLAVDVRAIYEVHPDFAYALAQQADETPNLERITEDKLMLFAKAGLTPAQAARTSAVFANIVAGTGLYYATIGREGLRPEANAAARRSYAALPPDEFPYSVAAAAHLFPNPDDSYHLSIEMLIESIAIQAERNARQPDDSNPEDPS